MSALGEDYGHCFRGGATATASKWDQLRAAKSFLPENGRFQSCHYNVEKRAQGVGLYIKGDGAWFGQVYRCGSVWICPVCARRLAEIRRAEIQEAVDNAGKAGAGVALITLTFPHGTADALAPMLEKFGKAQRALKSGRAAKARAVRFGFIGEIRTLEVTHGENGWHPHAHSVWITEKPLNLDQAAELRDELHKAWLSACLRVGLPAPSKEHGVDVRAARRDVAEYLGKWGFAAELSATTSKRAKRGGRTPWELLADATLGDHRSRVLWREFAHAFFGRRQLFWSRGLRDLLRMAPELTAQEALDLEDGDHKQQVAVIDLTTWHCIRKGGAHERVLYLALTDRQGLFWYLNELRRTVPMEDGAPPCVREDWES
jgi:hypothetical protein